jgi:hypothetical protein
VRRTGQSVCGPARRRELQIRRKPNRKGRGRGGPRGADGGRRGCRIAGLAWGGLGEDGDRVNARLRMKRTTKRAKERRTGDDERSGLERRGEERVKRESKYEALARTEFPTPDTGHEA